MSDLNDRICAAIEILRSEEQDAVTLFYDNPDFDGPNNVIKCLGNWTSYKDRRFEGDSLVECLEKAVESKTNGS